MRNCRKHTSNPKRTFCKESCEAELSCRDDELLVGRVVPNTWIDEEKSKHQCEITEILFLFNEHILSSYKIAKSTDEIN